MSFELFLVVGFLFGIGFGFFIQRAGFCIAHGLGAMFAGKGKRITRLLLVIFAITSAGFLLSAWVSPQLGLKPIGQIRGFGFYNLLSGILFGAGILLAGGCILGTLRQIGEGNVTYVLVLVSFIPGMALTVYVLDPLLQSNFDTKNVLLPDILGTPAVYVTGALVVLAILGYIAAKPRKRKKTRNTITT